MLEEIHINNLGIIEKADLEFHPGLTVISGETGAGKTMILTGLKLLLGRRASSDSVGQYKDKLSVEGCWNLSETHPIFEAIADTGAEIEDGELFINRSVDSAGKSKSIVGGKRTPANVLKDIGEGLVAIHGQSDQIKLKDSNAQRDALDRFGGENLAQLLKTYETLHKEWKTATKNLKSATENSAQRQLELNALEAFVEAFDEIDPQEGEIETIETRIQELSHMEHIREGLLKAFGVLNGDGGDEVTSINDLAANLEGEIVGVAKYSPAIKEFATLADEIRDKLSELTDSVEDYIDNIDSHSLQELEESKDRLIDLKDFIRRNGGDLESIFKMYETSAKKLSDLKGGESSIEELEAKVKEISEVVQAKADEITNTRKELATALSAKVNEELAGLAMKGSSLIIGLKKLDKLSLTGQDEVEFLIKAAGRANALPITKAASGGELSRIMLSLEVSLNDKNSATTLIFDEVDSGVGGATAIEIGKRLAKLSKDSQVIVVTHLAQVACYADQILKVNKTEPTSENESVKVSVAKLDREETVQEITRLLSGVIDSESGREHAKELLAIACSHKQS